LSGGIGLGLGGGTLQIPPDENNIVSRTLPQPGSDEAPKYWMHQTGGHLVPAVERYLSGDELTIRDIALIQSYLRQWIDSPVWEFNPYLTPQGRFELATLRTLAKNALTKHDLDRIVRLAVDLGLDPL